MKSPLIDHAHLYHQMGFAIFPVYGVHPKNNSGFACACGNASCRSPGKHPDAKYAPNGVKDASKDWETIKRWLKPDEYINIGIATGAESGFFALDIDPRHGGDETIVNLQTRHGYFPNTVRFQTGGGGEHILFRYPGITIPNSVGKIGKGVDVRGDGGYIVAPPSVHVSGRPYAIDVDAHPEDYAIAEAPTWFLEIILEKEVSPERRLTDWRSLAHNGVASGERNSTIARLAGLLLRNRLDPWVTAELMLTWNACRCSPPLSEAEVMSVVCNIAKKEINRRGGEQDVEF